MSNLSRGRKLSNCKDILKMRLHVFGRNSESRSAGDKTCYKVSIIKSGIIISRDMVL